LSAVPGLLLVIALRRPIARAEQERPR
jgi:hypothetical protein